MKLSKEGRQFIIDREGFIQHVYKDAAGLPTIGVGHLLTKSELCSGKIGAGDKWYEYSDGLSVDAVIDILDEDLRSTENYIFVAVDVPLTQNQYDALVSFVFNIGRGAFAGSTLLKRLNEKNYAAVPEQMKRWKYSAGKVVQGLINRREKEVALWLKA